MRNIQENEDCAFKLNLPPNRAQRLRIVLVRLIWEKSTTNIHGMYFYCPPRWVSSTKIQQLVCTSKNRIQLACIELVKDKQHNNMQLSMITHTNRTNH